MQSPTNATTATMKALRLEHWQSPAVLRDVDRPEPGPGEVLVQVGGAGACHSDLHLMHEFGEGQLPWSTPVHPRPRERRLGAHAGRRGHRPRAGAAGRRRRRLGLRHLRALPGGPGDVLRPPRAAPARRAVAAASGSTAGWPSTSSCPTPATWSRCRGTRPGPRGAAHRRRAHAVPRRASLVGQARPRLHRRRHRGRRPRSPGGPDPARHDRGAGSSPSTRGSRLVTWPSAAAPTSSSPPGDTLAATVREATGGIGADVVLDFVGIGRDAPRGRRDGARSSATSPSSASAAARCRCRSSPRPTR